MKKLNLNYGKLIAYLTIFLVIIFCFIYFPICQLNFDITSWIIIGVFLILYVAIIILIFKTFKMEYDDKAFYYTRLSKIEVIKFQDVLYIDEPYTIRHKALTIYFKNGKLRFITLDKDNKILQVFKEKCHNQISREEFQRRFPTIKL